MSRSLSKGFLAILCQSGMPKEKPCRAEAEVNLHLVWLQLYNRPWTRVATNSTRVYSCMTGLAAERIRCHLILLKRPPCHVNSTGLLPGLLGCLERLDILPDGGAKVQKPQSPQTPSGSKCVEGGMGCTNGGGWFHRKILHIEVHKTCKAKHEIQTLHLSQCRMLSGFVFCRKVFPIC